MLNWIKRPRSDHPLDEKDAERTLSNDLAGKNPVLALEDVAGYLDSIKTAENLKPARAFEIVDLLDRAGQPFKQQLDRQYAVEGERLTKFQQTRLMNTVSLFLTEVATGYRFCLAKYEVGAVGAQPLKAQLPLITCRAMRALAEQLKWTLLRYGAVETGVWTDLGSLYKLGESLQFAQSAIQLYRGAERTSSPEREFLAALMLAASSPDGLLPQQIEVAWRVIDHLAQYFRIAASPSAGAYYVFDLSGARPPGRVSSHAAPTPTTRCFGPGDAFAAVEQMVRIIAEENTLPPRLALPPETDLALVRTTLEHLVRYWAPVLPERTQRRHRLMEHVAVVHNFEEVVAQVGGLFLESSFVSNDEEWVVENESEGGFGAYVAQPNGAWVSVGKLIGVRREEGVSWGVGILRRVSMDAKGDRYVGIQMLARGGAAVTILTASMSAKDSPIQAEGELCVLLRSAAAPSDEASLLMRAGLFSPERHLVMRAYDRQYALEPLGIVERSDEFDIGRYRMVEESA